LLLLQGKDAVGKGSIWDEFCQILLGYDIASKGSTERCDQVAGWSKGCAAGLAWSLQHCYMHGNWNRKQAAISHQP
jgi:hypothetical protein